MKLNEGQIGKTYIIKKVDTGKDDEMRSFLFSLGCYDGEPVTIIDKKTNLIIAVKDARYGIDKQLADAIEI